MAIGTLSGAAMGFIDYGPLGLLAGGAIGFATVPVIQIGLAINAYRSTQSKKFKR